MADISKTSFPLMPIGQWWALRKKFKQTIPGIVTDTYLASVLKNMTPSSARTNILPTLRITGLIDDNGKPTDLAIKWRDDVQYKEVCAVIIKNIFPSELIDAFSGPDLDRDGCRSWFSNHTGAGEDAVRKMVTFYILLNEADIESANKISDTSNNKNNGVSSIKPKKGKEKTPRLIKQKEQLKENITHTSNQPTIHLNLQIHISSDASSDQIDKIFESMAKHIYKDNLTNA